MIDIDQKTETVTCKDCGKKSVFAKSEWKKISSYYYCRSCIAVRESKLFSHDTSKEDLKLIDEISDRAILLLKEEANMGHLIMDITAVHENEGPLNLKKLLSFDDFNFSHDVLGIYRNIDRQTGLLNNFFFPRCGKSVA